MSRSWLTYRPAVEPLEQRDLLAGVTDPSLVILPAVLPLPAVGVSMTDPAFGTTLRRVSDTSDRGGFESHIYSQLQAFSADNAYLLLTGSDGYLVRRVGDLSRVAGLDTSEWNVPRWHPTRAHTLVHFDTNADTDLTLQFTNLDTLATTDVFTFPPSYRFIVGNQSFDEISGDGRWLAGFATRDDGERVIFALDMENRSLGALLPMTSLYTTGGCAADPVWGQVEPDWIAASPLGKHLVVGWPRDGTARCSGLETFDIRTGVFSGRVYDGHQHGDLGVAPDGVSEFFMTFELAAPAPNNDRPAIGMRLLPGTATVSPPTFLQVLDWGNAEHISARGPHGLGLVTAGTLADNGWNPFEGEVFVQYTNGSVLRLAHHRSSSSEYWVQPRASISRDGRYVVFASDWGRPTDGRGDPYIIDLQPSSSVPVPEVPGPVVPVPVDPVPENPVPEESDADRFLAALYRDLLGRPADPAGQAYWSERLQGGLSRSEVALIFWQTAEHRGLQIGEYYATFLKRRPGAAEVAYWLGIYQSDAGEAGVLRGIITSPEYLAAHLSDRAFLEGLYTDLLSAAPDPGGETFWLDALRSGASRAEIVQGFLTSQARYVRSLNALYSTYLNRPADPAGQSYWLDRLATDRATLDMVAAAVLGAEEFLQTTN